MHSGALQCGAFSAKWKNMPLISYEGRVPVPSTQAHTEEQVLMNINVNLMKKRKETRILGIWKEVSFSTQLNNINKRYYNHLKMILFPTWQRAFAPQTFLFGFVLLQWSDYQGMRASLDVWARARSTQAVPHLLQTNGNSLLLYTIDLLPPSPNNQVFVELLNCSTRRLSALSQYPDPQIPTFRVIVYWVSIHWLHVVSFSLLC